VSKEDDMKGIHLALVMLTLIAAGTVSFNHGIALLSDGAFETGKAYYLTGCLLLTVAPLVLCFDNHK
jgi:hypothetical protein